MRKNSVTLLASMLLPAIAVNAEITLPHYITDNMIMQQNSILKIRGKSAPDSEITVNAGWIDDSIDFHSDNNGNFIIDLPTPPAGGPYSITFKDRDSVKTLENILSGEVWICSGQSNMEFPVNGWTSVMDQDNVIATAHHPDIRLLQVKKRTSPAPLDDIEVNGEGWQICSSASVADFSAIAYFFALELNKELRLPIGVIDTTWGGTPAEAWTSAEALGAVPGFEADLADLKASGFDRTNLSKINSKRLADWMKLATSSSIDFDKSVMQSDSAWNPIEMPGYWEKSVLPDFDGIVWLQKEIDIPAELTGKDFTLRFSAIDDEDETYFNGTLIGKGSGYDTPRDYRIPGNLIKQGANVITIKVSDFGGEGGIAPGIAEAATDGGVIPIDGKWQYMVVSDFSKLPAKPADPNGSSYPTVLYNAMLHPLRDMPVKGTLWYQGCANVGRDEQYAPLFKALIKDWCKLWNDDMPFYFVQLAGYLAPKAVQPESKWAALRNAQAKALELDNTAMAAAIDLGNPADIHPRNKQDVAHRLALIALNRDYGKDCVYEAPKCVSIKPSGNAMILKFNAPLKSTSSAISGFIIAGKDGHFTTATPKLLDNRTIELSSPIIARPEYVRYNWADYPCGNLYGQTGLPVAPFANDR